MRSTSFAALRGALCSAALALGLVGAANGQVVISQVYPGGGNSPANGTAANVVAPAGTATYISDYIELKNVSDCPIDLAGWSIQSSAATGGTWTRQNLSGVIQPGGYYLIQGATPANFAGDRGLPFPINGGISTNFSPAGGRVALVRSVTTLGSTGCPAIGTSDVIDLLGWGNSTCSTGSVAAALNDNTLALVRGSTGCANTGSNGADFGTGTATPRNALAPAAPCTTVVQARACCNATTGACITIATTTCPAGTTLQGVGICCVPNSCPVPEVTCCINNSCFTGVSQSLCQNTGGVVIGVGVSCTPNPCVPPAIRISQVFGGGDADNASPFNRDFVELYNASDADVDLAGWSLHYAANTTGFSQLIQFSSNLQPSTNPVTGRSSTIIPARGYYLISLGAGNTTTPPSPARPALPRPDWLGDESMSTGTFAVAYSGKFALVTNRYVVVPGTPYPTCPGLPRADVADYVSFGSGPTCAENTPTGTDLNSTTSVTRKGLGCVDSNDNFNDFMQPLPPTTARNSSSATNACSSTAMGACCAGTCVLTTADACGGGFQGPGTTCTPSDPCIPPTGRCCLASGACSVVTEQACTQAAIDGGLAEYVSWQRFGACTPTNLCIGACCSGTTCALMGRDQCEALGGGAYWVFNITVCNPGFCTTPSRVEKGDIAYGAGVTQNQDAVWQIRGPGTGATSGTRVGTWTRYDQVQGMRFDSSFGSRANARGNLLGLIFGTTTFGTGGATLVNLPTNGSNNGQILYRFGSTDPLNTFNAPQSRYAGLSVSPNNQYLALVGYDNSKIVFLGYNAGPNPGTGTNASITGAWSVGVAGGLGAGDLAFSSGFNQSSVWLDDSTLVVVVRNTNGNFTGPGGVAPLGVIIATIPMTPSGPGTPVYRLAPTDSGYDSSRHLALAYDPSISPYIYLANSAFGGQTINVLSVIDPTTWTEIKFAGFTASTNTAREIAVGPDKHLYISQFAGSGSTATSPVIDRINLDKNNDGAITAVDAAAINDNFLDTTSDYFFKGAANTNSFNGMGLAASTSDVVCCRGTTCTVVSAESCTVPAMPIVGVAQSVASACGINNSTANGCCFADFTKSSGVNIDDIFVYLNAWFASSPYTDMGGNGTTGPNIDDIFIYLNAWFAGCPS